MSSPHYLLQWSTPSHSQSLETVRRFQQLAPFKQHSLQNIEWTLRHTRKAFDNRIACILDAEQPITEGLAQPIHADGQCEQLVYVLTGQGSQFSGMAAGIYHHFSESRALIDQGCDLIKEQYGVDLLPLLVESSEANNLALQETSMAQPALFIFAMSYLALLDSSQLSCDTLVGHSLGEFAVACYAGVWDFQTALNVVFLRGRLMGSAEPGAMLACQLSESQLSEVLGSDWSQRVDLAAVNSSAQRVLSVPDREIAPVLEALKAKNIRHTRLATSHAYHSRSMTPILDAFAQVIESSRPKVPHRSWYSNLTGSAIDPQQVITADYWCQHLRETVRFGDAVINIAKDYPNALMLEVGAKSQLSPLIGEVSQSVACISNDPERSGEREWLATLAKLWVHGFDLDWQLWRPCEGWRVPLPSIALAPRLYWAQNRVTAPQASVLDNQEHHRGSETKTSNIKMLWSEILGIESEKLNRDDHFFSLGGSSIDLLDLVWQISASGGELSIAGAYQCLRLGDMEEKVNGSPNHGVSHSSLQEEWVKPFELSQLCQEEIISITEQWKTQGVNSGTLE